MQKKIILFILIIFALIFVVLFLLKETQTYRAIDITPETKSLINSQLVYIPTDADDPIYGNPGAALTIVEFIDFGCTQCRQAHAQLYKFVNDHPLEVRMIWKDAPSSGWFGSGSMLAHQAAYCAFRQNKFWEFANQTALDKANLKNYNLEKIADGLKLDMDKWQTCLTADETKNKIKKTLDLAQALGINELPGIFVNNKKIYIPRDIDFEEMLNKFIVK